MTTADDKRRNFFAFDARFIIRAGIIVLSLLVFAIVVSRLVYPFDAGNAEALSWIPARHLLAGENPYAFAFAPPYSMTPYGIVYYALLAVGVKIFGLQLWWGRILSVAAFLICLLSAAKITRRLTENKEAVFVTVLAGLAFFPMQMWVGLMRSDLMAAAFAFAALALAFTIDEKNKPTVFRVAAIVLLASLAFFTKHTYSLPACFIFLRFVQTGERRAAFFFAAAFGALLAAGIFLLDYTSAGGYVWQHFVHARGLPFSFENLTGYFPATPKLPAFSFFLIFLFLFLYRAAKVFAGDRLKRARVMSVLRSPRFLIFVYFVLSFATAFLSSGRVGANVNYYIENSLAAIIICGLIYNSFQSGGARRKSSSALVVYLIFGGVFQSARILHGEFWRWQAVGYYREVYRRTGEITAADADAPRENLCVAAFPEFVAPNGCALEFDDIGEYDIGWSPELNEIFEREIKSGRYAAIIWYNDHLQERFPNYRLVEMRENLPHRAFPVFLYERAEP